MLAVTPRSSRGTFICDFLSQARSNSISCTIRAEFLELYFKLISFLSFPRITSMVIVSGRGGTTTEDFLTLGRGGGACAVKLRYSATVFTEIRLYWRDCSGQSNTYLMYAT